MAFQHGCHQRDLRRAAVLCANNHVAAIQPDRRFRVLFCAATSHNSATIHCSSHDVAARHARLRRHSAGIVCYHPYCTTHSTAALAYCDAQPTVALPAPNQRLPVAPNPPNPFSPLSICHSNSTRSTSGLPRPYAATCLPEVVVSHLRRRGGSPRLALDVNISSALNTLVTTTSWKSLPSI